MVNLRGVSSNSTFVMSTSGLSVNTRCAVRLPGYGWGPLCRQPSSLPAASKRFENVEFLRLERQRKETQKIQWTRSAMEASYGDLANVSTGSAVFPRINIRDPYKRLGISREASEEEIQAARNFLVQRYAGDKPSIQAIESAYDKIIMEKLYERRNPKIDFKKKIREVNQSRFMQFFRSRLRTPPKKFITKTAIAFLLLGALTVLFPTEEGPTLQVAISLMATIYFLHERLKSKFRAFLCGFGAFFCSWLLGTFLMVSVIPPIPVLKGPRSFEVISSLMSYILLWVSSTYLVLQKLYKKTS